MALYQTRAIFLIATIIIWVVLVSMFVCSFADLEKIEHPINGDEKLNFLVVGDWGREGAHNQSEVAFQMGRVGEKLDIEFVAGTGDNFYDNGLTGIDDPSFEASFSRIYTAKSLQTPWYNVLGNHDYRGNTLAQLHPIFKRLDSRWNCKRSFTVNAGIGQLFFVDTTPLVDKYVIDNKHTYDWRGTKPRKIYIANTLKDLDMALRESTAQWKIVIAHHAIRSAGYHGDTRELIRNLLPILKANHVDLYINGHDHCLQHISSQDSPLQFVTSGAGSKAWRGYVNPSYSSALKFFHDGQGFISVELTQKDAHVVFYNVFGEILHKFTVKKEGPSKPGTFKSVFENVLLHSII